MGNFNFGKYRILTSATNIDATGKTLIISTHGALTGTSFERPYPTVVQFCTPKMTSLRAALDEVIAGRVTASDLASSSQKTIDDYSLTWFEGDPNDNSCVFCRVSAAQFEGGTYVGGSTLGALHQTVSQVNRHKVNATALALELQQKKGFK